ncbi:hypothetical protein ACFWXK_10775 [Streptomyces sp. NPDC059070]|uniref:hypothetical protein n=1 Tax=Streptomyces sp. NPDC059070 TaxID=3346713 RepID=UPI00368E6DBC
MGPAELKALVRTGGEGRGMRSSADFGAWVSALPLDEPAEPSRFVVDGGGVLRPAPRRSEHLVCADGGEVLSAGEMSFREEAGRWVVDEVSTQSTGCCPDVSSWPAVAQALDRIGIPRPSGFTHEVAFRRCRSCRELSIVREDEFVCVLCGEDLPRQWNVREPG